MRTSSHWSPDGTFVDCHEALGDGRPSPVLADLLLRGAAEPGSQVGVTCESEERVGEGVDVLLVHEKPRLVRPYEIGKPPTRVATSGRPAAIALSATFGSPST